ncbi:MAG: hypothetical protein JWM36_2739 [Hyphomicrobiales bacterium]|nr:hypothetical protein [Hyphomicrobiales bacterium]
MRALSITAMLTVASTSALAQSTTSPPMPILDVHPLCAKIPFQLSVSGRSKNITTKMRDAKIPEFKY